MKERIYILTRGDNPVVVSENSWDNSPIDNDFPKDCVAFVRRSYEGQLFGKIRGTDYTLYTEDICATIHVDAQKGLREMKSNPTYRNYLEIKKVGSIVTVLPTLMFWDKATKDGGRIIYSFSLERGDLFEEEFDSDGNLRQQSLYCLSGNSTIESYENGIRKIVKERYEF